MSVSLEKCFLHRFITVHTSLGTQQTLCMDSPGWVISWPQYLSPQGAVGVWADINCRQPNTDVFYWWQFESKEKLMRFYGQLSYHLFWILLLVKVIVMDIVIDMWQHIAMILKISQFLHSLTCDPSVLFGQFTISLLELNFLSISHRVAGHVDVWSNITQTGRWEEYSVCESVLIILPNLWHQLFLYSNTCPSFVCAVHLVLIPPLCHLVSLTLSPLAASFLFSHLSLLFPWLQPVDGLSISFSLPLDHLGQRTGTFIVWPKKGRDPVRAFWLVWSGVPRAVVWRHPHECIKVNF